MVDYQLRIYGRGPLADLLHEIDADGIDGTLDDVDSYQLINWPIAFHIDERDTEVDSSALRAFVSYHDGIEFAE